MPVLASSIFEELILHDVIVGLAGGVGRGTDNEGGGQHRNASCLGMKMA
jgi:hypothetical protein